MNSELKAVWEVYKPFKKHLRLSFICLAGAQALGLAAPIIAGKTMNIMVKKDGLMLLAVACALHLIVSLIQGWISQYRDGQELEHLDYDLKKSMRKKTSKQMLSLSIGQHHSEHSGIKHRIVSEGEKAVVDVFRMMMYEVTPFIFEVVLCALICPFYDPILGTVVILSVVLTYLLSKRYTDKYVQPIMDQDRADDKTTKIAREIVQHVELIKLNGREEFAVAEQDRMLTEVSNGWKAIWIPFNNLLWNAAIFPRSMRTVVMFFAGLRAYEGDISVGAALIIWSLSSSSIGRVGSMSYFQRTWMANKPRIARYVEFLSIVPDVKNAADALKVPRFMGEVEFRNVSFRYPTKPLMKSDDIRERPAPEREFVVKDVSFVLDPGMSYALVGASGAGKTTVKHLCARSFDPTCGVVKIDGYPVTHLDLDLLHARIGVVDQEVPLLDRSLRDNLLFLLPEDKAKEVTQERIEEACRMACIDKFYHRLEHGLDTVIGERGVKLSGGEKQRVAIARAILKDPDIFIFDEATSSLDSINEDDIVNAIRSVSHGKTTLMIAHRFSTILSADRIIVMDQGEVVGQGEHRELLATCPAYERLIAPQMRIFKKLALV